LKVKVRYEGTFLVGGVLGLPEAVEGLLVGERIGRRLLYRGTVQWGVGRRTAEELLARCRTLKEPPSTTSPEPAGRLGWSRACASL
jgi:hypothetical protein